MLFRNIKTFFIYNFMYTFVFVVNLINERLFNENISDWCKWLYW